MGRRRYWIPSALVLFLVLLGGSAYALVPDPAPEAVVPHLAGASSIEEAREMAGDRFEVVEGSRVEGTEAVGTIVAQSPYAGEMAEEGSEISVDVVGIRIADVPDVQGKRARRPSESSRGGFRGRGQDRKEFRGRREPGNRAESAWRRRQDRQGRLGRRDHGRRGTPNVEVPSITDHALSGTEQILEEAGLKLGSQMEVPNDRVPVGHIVEQHPAAGMKMEPGSAVDVVGSGSAATSRPESRRRYANGWLKCPCCERARFSNSCIGSPCFGSPCSIGSPCISSPCIGSSWFGSRR